MSESRHSAQWANEDAYAADLLAWAQDHARLVIDHVAWSNKLIAAECDAKSKTITFHPPRNTNLAFFHRQLEADRKYGWSMVYHDFPRLEFSRLLSTFKAEASHSRDGLNFNPRVVANHPDLCHIEQWVNAKVFPELEGEFNVGAYRMRDLRHFLAMLYTTCTLISTSHDEMLGTIGDQDFPGAPIFQAEWEHAIEWLREASGLSTSVVAPIVRDLTLNPARFHCSISTTPFVLSRSNTLFLQPYIFMHIDLQRSFASALTCGTGQKSYDRISTIVERHHIDVLVDLINKHGLQATAQTTFETADKTSFSPDIIVTDRRTHTVLVVEFKNILSAFGPASVAKRISEIHKGMHQVNGYVRRLTQQPELLRRFRRDCLPFQPLPINVIGLLLLRSPMPVPIPSSQTFIDDELSIRNRLMNLADSADAPTVYDLLPQDDFVNQDLPPHFIFNEIQVEDWLYRRSVLFIPNEE